jgi:hypothetical protein
MQTVPKSADSTSESEGEKSFDDAASDMQESDADYETSSEE